MAKDIAKTSATQLPSANLASRQTVRRGAGSGFIKRMELKSKGSLIDRSILPPGSFCVPSGSDSALNLTKEVDLMVLGYRQKALDMSGGDVTELFDESDPVYQDIKARASIKDSYCQEGTTVLVFERSTRDVYEFFFGPKSLQAFAYEMVGAAPLSKEEIEAEGLQDVKPHGPLTVHLRAVLSPSKKYSYFIPEISVSSDPIVLTDSEVAYVSEMVTKFVNTKPRKPEVVDAPAGQTSRG